MLTVENLGVQAAQPNPAPEGDPAEVLPFYISVNEASGLYPSGVDMQQDGTLIDKGSGQVVGIDPMAAAFNGSPVQADALNDEQVEDLLGQLTDLNPQNALYDYDSKLRDDLLAVKESRSQAAAGGSPDHTAQMPAAELPDADAGRRQRRGVMDWANDRITRMEQTAPIKAAAKQERKDRKDEAKAAKKDLKTHKKLYPRLDEIQTTDSETFEQGKAAVKAERTDLEERAGSYKAWRKAQRAEHSLVSRTVAGIRRGLRITPEERTTRKNAKQERNAARDVMATAHHRLLYINNQLRSSNLDADKRAELEAERTERLATHEEAHERFQANRRRTVGRQARKNAENSNPDAAFDEIEFPSDEARDLFKDLHDKRIKTLKLGLQSGYKLFKGTRGYKKAYAEYRKAFIACEAAIFKHAEAEAGGELSEEQESALAKQVVINEIFAMETWQSQLAAEAQGTRRGRAAMWFHRQKLGTKILLGVTAGLATGGLAGFAGGAAAGVGIAATKVARSRATQHASGLARQNAHEITDKDRERYFDEDITTGEAFNRIAQDQMNYVQRKVWKKRVGVGVAVGSMFVGHWIGDKLNDHLHGSHGGGHRTTTGGRSGGQQPGGTGEGAGGTAGGPTTTRDTVVRGLTPRGGSAGAAHLPEGGGTGSGVGSGVAGAAAEQAAGAARIDTSLYPTTWDWAEATFGRGNGTPALLKLAEVAQQHGHQVVGLGNRFSLDGQDNKDYIIQTLVGLKDRL